MIISSVENEPSHSWADSSLESITLEQVVEKLKRRAGFGAGFGDKAQEVVDSYAKAFPGKKPVEIWSLARSNRQGVVALADVKSKQPAPVYVDWFRNGVDSKSFSLHWTLASNVAVSIASPRRTCTKRR